MIYYIEINDNKITSKGAIDISESFNLNNNQMWITEEEYNQLIRLPACFDINENGDICNIVNANNPPEYSSAKDVDQAVVQKIREKYDQNEEEKLKRLAINALIDQVPISQEYTYFNTYVEECRGWGKSKKIELGFTTVE